MRRIAFLFLSLVIGCLFATYGYGSNSSQPESETIEINRLVGLCKLWGYVKYFHPSLAYRSDIDWDAALVATIPQVRKAHTPAEYAAALQGLLSILDDSLTQVVINT